MSWSTVNALAMMWRCGLADVATTAVEATSCANCATFSLLPTLFPILLLIVLLQKECTAPLAAEDALTSMATDLGQPQAGM
jgi:hypothetical protein